MGLYDSGPHMHARIRVESCRKEMCRLESEKYSVGGMGTSWEWFLVQKKTKVGQLGAFRKDRW